MVASRKLLWDWTPLSSSQAYELSKYGEEVSLCAPRLETDDLDEVFSIEIPPNREAWLSQRRWVSETLLLSVVEIDPKIRGGVPLLRNTRMTISQLLGELADGRTTTEICEAFDLDVLQFQKLLEGMAMQFDRPF